MKKLLLGSFIYFTFFLPDIAFACATCFGDPNPAATQGMNKAIITMLGITDEKGESYNAFRGLNHVYTLKTMDDITTIWHILSMN